MGQNGVCFVSFSKLWQTFRFLSQLTPCSGAKHFLHYHFMCKKGYRWDREVHYVKLAFAWDSASLCLFVASLKNRLRKTAPSCSVVSSSTSAAVCLGAGVNRESNMVGRMRRTS